MELFSEIYGCYYSVVARILRQAHRVGLTHAEVNQIVDENAFSESGFHLMPRLLGGEWDLLLQEDGRYLSKLKHWETELPLTGLQKAWLKALLQDRRIRLFLEDDRLVQLGNWLEGVEPLFDPADFHTFDTAADGDNYADETYILHFRMVLDAIHHKQNLLAQYESGKGGRLDLHFLPQKLLYSAKDDKFRVIGRQITGKGTKHILLNMARIQTLTDSERLIPERLLESTPVSVTKHTVQIAISYERNALERCMLQFASYDKQTAFDEATNRYLCDISYDILEETELLIRILSFGPVVEVLGPEPFLRQVRERVRMQIERMAMDIVSSGDYS